MRKNEIYRKDLANGDFANIIKEEILKDSSSNKSDGDDFFKVAADILLLIINEADD